MAIVRPKRRPTIPEFDITEIAKILVQLGLRDFMVGFVLLFIENILNKESIKPAIAGFLSLTEAS
jgi:mannitol-1-phosphate/altronate dehydrogenase